MVGGTSALASLFSLTFHLFPFTLGNQPVHPQCDVKEKQTLIEMVSILQQWIEHTPPGAVLALKIYEHKIQVFPAC